MSGEIDGGCPRLGTGPIVKPIPTVIHYSSQYHAMQSSHGRALRNACKRYGPGRLPNADRPDIGAGYAAASAAVLAAGLFGILLSVRVGLGTSGDWIASFLFPALALPIVVPSAFLIGIAGWRLIPSSSTITGIIAGGLGAIATYLVSFVLLGGVLTAAAVFSLSGAALMDAAEVSAGLVAVAFVLTWWITIPVGCLSGGVYVNVTESVPRARSP